MRNKNKYPGKIVFHTNHKASDLICILKHKDVGIMIGPNDAANELSAILETLLKKKKETME